MSLGVWRAAEDLSGVARAERLPDRIAIGGGLALLVRGAYRVDRPGLPPTLEFAGTRVALRAVLPPSQQVNGRFWAVVDLAAGTSGASELNLNIPRDNGTVCRLLLGSVAFESQSSGSAGRSQVGDGHGPQVAICMATYEPDRDLFIRQIQSLRAQTCRSWRVVISDDGSAAEARAIIAEAVAGDERFTVVWNDERLGSYHNFERALLATPDDARAIAFCDQDDYWYPEKLESMLSRLPVAGLVVSDARLVDTEERLLSETFWTSRRHLPCDLRSISVANSVPGCMSLWDASLKPVVLPFPPTMHTLHHDGWVAAVAAATGGIHRLRQPLIDHVQHSANTLGHDAAVSRRIGRLGRRDSVLALIPAWRRDLVAQEIDAALRPEVLARTIRLRSQRANTVNQAEVGWGSRDDNRLDRVAEHLRRGLVAEFRRGLPGTDYAVARGLIAARLYASPTRWRGSAEQSTDACAD
jgi:glycosyltransferase involved in cell wall biosynthesis